MCAIVVKYTDMQTIYTIVNVYDYLCYNIDKIKYAHTD